MSDTLFTAIIASPIERASGVIAAFEKQIARSGQTVCKENDAFVVYTAPETAFLVNDAADTILIGTLFRGDCRLIELPSNAVIDGAEHLISECWGGYVALSRFTAGVELLRDPSGAVPCYHFQLAGTRVFTSDITAALRAASIEPYLNWTIIQQALIYRDLRPTQTALAGVDELHPGCAALVNSADIKIRTIWSPWTFTAARNEIADWADAVAFVGDAVNRCVTAWGARYEPALVEVSGGLDSSIVAAALSGGHCQPRAISFGPAPGDPDETPYARSVAEWLHLELKLEQLDFSAIDLCRSNAERLPRPCARSFTQSIDMLRQVRALDLNATAIFSGGGGDNVFCNQQSALPAVDCLLRHGLRRSTLNTVADIATVTRTTVWQVLAQTMRRTIRPRSANYWPCRSQYMAKELTHSTPFPDGHPWVQSPVGTLPGKRAHVMTLIGIQNHLEARMAQGSLPIVSPLLSQPVMEACLRIPTWLWCRGGINRAVAREAFREALPATVIDRSSKGAFDGFCAAIIQANQALFRDMLVNGSLARAGLLNIEEIKKDLTALSVNGESGARLLGLLDTEAWVRSWEDGRRYGARP